MTDDQPPGVKVEFHPARIVELSAEIMSLSVLDYEALMGRLEALREFSRTHLLPEIHRGGREEAPS